MRMPCTLEEAIECQRRLDERNAIGDAYISYDDKWKAVRFSMSIIREISKQNNDRNLKDVFDDIQIADGFEQYILKNYDVMHTQDLLGSVYDVQEYVGSR